MEKLILQNLKKNKIHINLDELIEKYIDNNENSLITDFDGYDLSICALKGFLKYNSFTDNS